MAGTGNACLARRDAGGPGNPRRALPVRTTNATEGRTGIDPP